MSNFIYELSEGKEIQSIDDFFEFLNRHVQKNTFAYVYYTYPLRMNKGGRGGVEPNPYYGQILKHKPYEFRWDRTYAEAQKALNPDYEFKGSKAEYTPVEGAKIIQNGKNGLYFPIVPTGNGGKTIYTTLDYQPIDESELAQWIPNKNYNPNFAAYMNCLVDRVAGISAGGAFWKNPDFKFRYMGRNAQKFQ